MKPLNLRWLLCVLLISSPALSQLNSSPAAIVPVALQQGTTRNVRMSFVSAGASGSSPLAGANVTVLAGNRTFTQRASADGVVLFNNVPCGGTLTVSVPDVSIATPAVRPVGRTFPLRCGGGTLSLAFFTCENGRLHADSDLPSLDVNLPGVITTERIQFRRGESTTQVRRSIDGGRVVNFLVGARSGQRIRVNLSSVGNEARFDLHFRQDRDAFIQSTGGNNRGCGGNNENITDFVGVLPSDGDYIISVYATRGAANFALELAVE